MNVYEGWEEINEKLIIPMWRLSGEEVLESVEEGGFFVELFLDAIVEVKRFSLVERFQGVSNILVHFRPIHSKNRFLFNQKVKFKKLLLKIFRSLMASAKKSRLFNSPSVTNFA